MNSSAKFNFSVFILVLFHVIGLVGLDLSSRPAFFEGLSWLNLLLSFLLLLLCHKTGEPLRNLLLFGALVFALGMIAEIIGVRHGLIFGEYYYTPTFGAAMFGVPLVIGINWVMLTYATGVFMSSAISLSLLRVVGGAALMTFCDIWLEGFAIRHHLWVWIGTGQPGLKNFIGWFLVSLLAHSVFQFLLPRSRNRLALFYIITFLVFLLADKLIVNLAK